MICYLLDIDALENRALISFALSFLITWLLAPKTIQWLRQGQIGQMIRDDGPQTHLSKKGTPTMGGVLIILSVLISMLICADVTNHFIYLPLFALVGFGFIGWVDDYKKLILKNSKGLTAKQKLLGQTLIAVLIGCVGCLSASSANDTAIHFPYFSSLVIPLGYFYVFWSFLVIVGASNAVNLTDGLDGLAIFPTVLIAAALSMFALVLSQADLAFTKQLSPVPGASEVIIFCAAIAGSGLAFLWFNTYPAELFMGDVGALSLGAALGTIALLLHQEILFVLMGGLFVIETVSVILQVGSYKLRGKRIFRMAPIHHHFELGGWPEPRVVVRFWILSIILILVSLTAIW